MKSEAPILATWTLRHFGSSPNNEAVIGDLQERYRHGKSHLWYWRQVFGAIFSSMVRQVSSNKFLALRGLLQGWVVLLLYWASQIVIRSALKETTADVWWSDPIYGWYPAIFLSCLLGIVSGWTASRVGDAYRRSIVVLFTSTVTVCAFVYFAALLVFTSGHPRPWLAHLSIAYWIGAGLLISSVAFGAGLFRAAPVHRTAQPE